MVTKQFDYIGFRECGQSEPQEEQRKYRLDRVNKNRKMGKITFVSQFLYLPLSQFLLPQSDSVPSPNAEF